MSDQILDEVDDAILFELQHDARMSNTEIAERIDMSVSAIGKRVTSLEDEGIIKGYQPEIDYRQINQGIRILFICTAPIPEREPLVQKALDLDAVVNVDELMTGQRNVHIRVVGQMDDITSTAHEIDDIGFTVNDEVLMRSTNTSPASVFGESNPDLGSENYMGDRPEN